MNKDIRSSATSQQPGVSSDGKKKPPRSRGEARGRGKEETSRGKNPNPSSSSSSTPSSQPRDGKAAPHSRTANEEKNGTPQPRKRREGRYEEIDPPPRSKQTQPRKRSDGSYEDIDPPTQSKQTQPRKRSDGRYEDIDPPTQSKQPHEASKDRRKVTPPAQQPSPGAENGNVNAQRGRRGSSEQSEIGVFYGRDKPPRSHQHDFVHTNDQHYVRQISDQTDYGHGRRGEPDHGPRRKSDLTDVRVKPKQRPELEGLKKDTKRDKTGQDATYGPEKAHHDGKKIRYLKKQQSELEVKLGKVNLDATYKPGKVDHDGKKIRTLEAIGKQRSEPVLPKNDAKRDRRPSRVLATPVLKEDS